MNAYIKAKLFLELVYSTVYASGCTFVFFKKPCDQYMNLTLIVVCVSGLLLSVFSFGSIKDRVSPLVQNLGYGILGVMLVSSLSCGIYLSIARPCDVSFFLYVFCGFECLRIVDLVFCIKHQVEYAIIT